MTGTEPDTSTSGPLVLQSQKIYKKSVLFSQLIFNLADADRAGCFGGGPVPSCFRRQIGLFLHC